MDWDTVQKLLAVAGVLIAAWRYIEMRIQSVKTEVLERIADINKVNDVIQSSLKEDVARIDAKLDQATQLLIQLIAQVNRNAGETGNTSR